MDRGLLVDIESRVDRLEATVRDLEKDTWTDTDSVALFVTKAVFTLFILGGLILSVAKCNTAENADQVRECAAACQTLGLRRVGHTWKTDICTCASYTQLAIWNHNFTEVTLRSLERTDETQSISSGP